MFDKFSKRKVDIYLPLERDVTAMRGAPMRSEVWVVRAMSRAGFIYWYASEALCARSRIPAVATWDI